MNSIKNEKMYKRNALIGKFTNYAALATLAVGVYYYFQYMQDPNQVPVIALATVVLGYFLTQFSTFFSSRWGREPRPDQQLESSLKGLTNEYSIYHYQTPVPHLLIGPAGIWILRPFTQRRGNLTYKRNRYRLTNTGFAQAYMSLFGQEGLGRPDLEAEGDIEAMTRFLRKNLAEEDIPTVNFALVFCGDNISIAVDEAPYPALPLKKLKSFIRTAAKEKPLSAEMVNKLKALLPE
ncbi:MAG: hypothetical protein JXA13_01485 [Anaerolineales bacterium]|nr:hypothetical protein [Anaerolineales bacterium]